MHEWWPEPEGGGASAPVARRTVGLFVRGSRHGKQRMRKVLQVASQPKKPHAKISSKKMKEAQAAKDAKAKVKKVKKPKLKKAKVVAIVDETLENFKRTGQGKPLVNQIMERLKSLDQKAFAENPLFDATSDQCRLTISACKGVPWSDILDAAHSYFKTVQLERVFSLPMFTPVISCDILLSSVYPIMIR